MSGSLHLILHYQMLQGQPPPQSQSQPIPTPQAPSKPAPPAPSKPAPPVQEPVAPQEEYAEEEYAEEEYAEEQQSYAEESGIGNCRALYDYEGEKEGDLPFKEGEIIAVLDDSDPSGWWQGSLNGVTGFFPSNFVERV